MKLFDLIIVTILLVAGGTFFALFLNQKSDAAIETCEPGAAIAQSAELAASEPPLTESYARIASLNRDNRNGHFYANAIVNQTTLKFLVDTGASSVALSKDSARKLGIDTQALDYRWNISTAGGDTKAAYVVLDRIKIQNIEVENVDAMVLETPLDTPLLGMTFLSQLYSYEFRQKHLILRQ